MRQAGGKDARDTGRRAGCANDRSTVMEASNGGHGTTVRLGHWT